MSQKLRVLFVCTGNSARSQMAEAFARHYGQGQVEVSSAGIDPKGLHPLTVKVMSERGIDVSYQASKALTDEILRKADYVVTVCGHADEHCPALPPDVRKLHWPIGDPAVLSGRAPEEVLAAFRQARDELESRVRDLLSTLERQ
ncbi:MAG: arsenate reductase ArsC [Candidatus Methylomirabilales bacterium]